MPISAELRRLQNKWQTGTGWPKRLEALEISGIRGWAGQRIDLNFPIVAIVGENHPEFGHRDFADVALWSLKAAFPCHSN